MHASISANQLQSAPSQPAVSNHLMRMAHTLARGVRATRTRCRNRRAASACDPCTCSAWRGLEGQPMVHTAEAWTLEQWHSMAVVRSAAAQIGWRVE